MKKHKRRPKDLEPPKETRDGSKYDPAFNLIHQQGEDGRRAPQHQADRYAAPKAPDSPLIAEHDNLPGLDAITDKYAEDLERGRQLSAKFGR